MKLLKLYKSKDGLTTKYLQKTDDNNIIETGYYNLDESVICLSSQIGCPMSCVFCATTCPVGPSDQKNSFVRNLTAKEIVLQAENIISFLQNKADTKKILFSYMGMGEPFLNYDNVIESVKILSAAFPNSRTTISTLGTKPALIKKLAHEKIDTTLKLHLSLHASNDELRKKIMPRAQKIKSALEALKYFTSIRNVPAKINYILIKGVNDSEKHAEQLTNLLKPYPFAVKLSNLNDYNNLESSDDDSFILFEKILATTGIKTCKFVSTGTDINAGCGQLRSYYYKKINGYDQLLD